jgi:peptide deformylase
MKVTVEGLDRDMNPVTWEAEGLLARAFCHEVDHLDGHMYTEFVEGEIHDTALEEAMEEQENAVK